MIQTSSEHKWSPERPVLLMGDFNCRPGSATYRVLVAEGDVDEPGRLQDTSKDHNAIDWILFKGPLTVMKYEEVDYNVNGVSPSVQTHLCGIPVARSMTCRWE